GGQSQAVSIQVERKWYAKPLQVRVSRLPKGVSAEIPRIAIAADESKADLILDVDPSTQAAVEKAKLELFAEGEMLDSVEFVVTVAKAWPREVTNSIGMKVVLIPNPNPQRKGVEGAFYAGVYEVTQAQYQKVMGYNPSYFSKDGEGKKGLKYLDSSRP